jgi:hypothetical protein
VQATLLAASVAAVAASVAFGPGLPARSGSAGAKPEDRREGRLAALVFRSIHPARMPVGWPRGGAVQILEGVPRPRDNPEPPAAFWSLSELPREWPRP